MDIVYILKKNSDNLELRFSLRSLKNIKYDNIFIIGYKPNWLDNVIHIEADDPYNIKSLNALHKIKIACQNERISEDFILMNDDFYILKPTEIKYWNRGSIKEHLEYRKSKNQSNSCYSKNLLKTFNLFPNGFDFSLHVPIIYNKDKFLKMCNEYDMTQGYLLRNLYCNHYGIVGETMDDCKVYDINDLKINGDFLSSDDGIIGNEFIDFMLNSFPNKSMFEFYNLNEDNMEAIANYNITLNGVQYKQGYIYEINPETNIKSAFGYRDYFTLINKGVIETDLKDIENEVIEKKDITKEYLFNLLKNNGINANTNCKLETLIKKCEDLKIKY